MATEQRRAMTDEELANLGVGVPARAKWGKGEWLAYMDGWSNQRTGTPRAYDQTNPLGRFFRAGYLEAQHWETAGAAA